MKTKLTVCLLAIAATSLAQSFKPIIQTSGVREKYTRLSPNDQKTPCGDPTATPAVNTYCDDLAGLFLPTELQVSFARYMVAKQEGDTLKSEFLSFLSSAAESRIDSQNGASSSGSGTTSVVERSGISDVLGVALESGGVTQTVSGTNLTLQGNALGLYRFVGNQEVFQYCPAEKPNCRGELKGFLNKLSGSATLGLSNASTQTATGTVASSGTPSGNSSQPSASALIQNSASHLTGFSIRFQAINTLDLRSHAYLDAWKKAITTDANLTGLAEAANKTAAFDFWKKTGADNDRWVQAELAALWKIVNEQNGKVPNDEALVREITTAWDNQIPTWSKNGMDIGKLKLFLQAANAYMQARDIAVNKVRQSLASGLTFEYAYSRPDNQPRVSTARVIYTLHPGTITANMPTTTQSGAKATTQAVTSQAKTPATASGAKKTNDSAITFNFAANMYDNPPPGTGVFRDLQGGLQLDHHFGNTIATLAGYYQYQNQPAALTIGAGNLAPGTNITLNGTAATLLAPKGNIVVAQAMVTFPLRSGTKLPVGVTWSNRTDLIKGNELRGHVGFNFDWSSLLLGGQAKAANPSQQ